MKTLKKQNAIFKIGKILAIIPGNRAQKTYSVIYFTVLTISVSLTYIYRKPFYLKFNLLKLLIKIAIDVTCYGFNFYTTVIVTCYKGRAWKLLLQNLGKFEDKKSNFSVVLFAITNLVFWALTVFTGWVWLTVIGVEYSRQYIFDVVQLYPLIYYNYLIVVFLKKIQDGLNSLKVSLNRNFESIEPKIWILRASIEHFNQIFAWPILFIIMYSYLRVLIYIDLTFRHGIKNLKLVAVIDNICIILLFVGGVVAMIIKCDNVRCELQEIARVLYTSSSTSPRIKILFYLVQDFPQISAARFFIIGRATIFKILSSICSFCIVLSQFSLK
ncbi:gustatory receptor 32 [Tribolium castaneum]|uniref:Gustatory receptor 32 n=1 Tax=Tribolium castaneum TaxID=7070 RepID=D2A4P3_TRICA|nr:gustatory receptor 32 [Tribolium castaneum]